jgi:hypothetical protein
MYISKRMCGNYLFKSGYHLRKEQHISIQELQKIHIHISIFHHHVSCMVTMFTIFDLTYYVENIHYIIVFCGSLNH